MTEDSRLPPGIAAAIHASFGAQGLMRTLGAELTDLAPGQAVIRAPLRPGNLQQHGHAHAGLTFAIGDSAAGYAALSTMPEGSEVLTTEMKIHLLAPGRGTALVARGRVIRAGRRLVVVQADLHAQQATGRETHVALMIGTMIPVPPD